MPKPVLLILVVEAEPVIQEVVNEALTGAGFDAEITSSGEEAVTLIRGDKSRYRALVTDINLRGKLNGWEVARRAREVVPDLPVVYMTASGHEYPAQGVPNSVLLQKPFASAPVVTAVSQLLNRIPPPHE